MKSLRKRLFGLPRPKEELQPLSFYIKQSFTAEDAAEIIGQWLELELESEESEASEAAQIHAWSILAHLGGKEGSEFLIDELCLASNIGDDFFIDHFSDLMLAAGSRAVPLLIARFESGREDESALLEMGHALTELLKNDVEKSTVLKVLVAALQAQPRHRMLKATIISDLVEITGDTYLAEIRQAFEQNLVNVSIGGDLEDVEIRLGLRPERPEPAPDWVKRETELAKASQLQGLGERPENGDDAGTIRYFLELHRGPQSAQSFAQFDGLMLGTILAPTPVPPSRFLPSIWDSEELSREPSWDNEEDAELFLTAVMNWHGDIICRLDEESYFPPFEPRSKPRVPTEEECDWARGILGSVFSWEVEEGETSEAHQAMMACALHLIRPTEGVTDAEVIQVDHVVGAAQMLREALKSGASLDGEFFGDLPKPVQSEAPKAGRNDLCPCGSGRKFKRCCGN